MTLKKLFTKEDILLTRLMQVRKEIAAERIIYAKVNNLGMLPHIDRLKAVVMGR